MFFSPFAKPAPVQNDLRLSFQLEAFVSGLLLGWPDKPALREMSPTDLAGFVSEEAQVCGVLQPSVVPRFKEWIANQAPRVATFLKSLPEPVPSDFELQVLTPQPKGLRTALEQDASLRSWLKENLDTRFYERCRDTLEEASGIRRGPKPSSPNVSSKPIDLVALVRDFFDLVGGLLKKGITIAAGKETFSTVVDSSLAPRQYKSSGASKAAPSNPKRQGRSVLVGSKGAKHATLKTGASSKKLVQYVLRGKTLEVKRDEWDRIVVRGTGRRKGEANRLIKAGWVQTKGNRVYLVPKLQGK